MTSKTYRCNRCGAEGVPQPMGIKVFVGAGEWAVVHLCHRCAIDKLAEELESRGWGNEDRIVWLEDLKS